VVLAARPDLVLDFGSVGPTYVSLADRVQEQIKLPYILLDGSLSATARAYTLAGDLLDVGDRGKELARYVERTLADVFRRTIPTRRFSAPTSWPCSTRVGSRGSDPRPR
jgi:iron complex transport system substrate-binding protein